MQRIKKVMAGIGTALMAGATLASPVFAQKTIGEAFGEMTTENTVVVVGENAAVSDVVAAIAIAAKLGQNGAEVSVTGGETRLEGVEEKDVNLNSGVGPLTLKDNDVAGLKDATLDWNDEVIDYEEIVSLSGNLVVMTSSSYDEDFGAEPYLGTTAKKAITYYVKIADRDFDNYLVSENEPLEITVAGRSLKIVDISPDDPGVTGENNAVSASITYESGIEKAMSVGDTVEIEGKTVKINAIGQDTVEVEVDGQTEFIDKGKTSEVGNTGIKVEVKSILYNSQNPDASRALLRIGSEIRKTVQDGDSAELFGEPENDNDAEWVWYIKTWNITSDSTAIKIGLTHNQLYDTDKEPVVGVGESIVLPDDYVRIEFTKLNVNDDDYVTIRGYFESGVDIEVDEDGSPLSLTNNNAFILQASEPVFNVEVNGVIEETDTVYIFGEAAGYNGDGDANIDSVVLAYKNDDNDVQVFAWADANDLNKVNATDGEISIINEDAIIPIQVERTAANVFTITLDEANDGVGVGNDLAFVTVDVGNRQLGTNPDEAEAGEITYGGNSIGSREDSVLTDFGVIVETPKTNGGSDEVVVKVPSEQVQATIRVYGPASQVTTTAAEGAVDFPAVTPNVGKLDTEVSSGDKSNYNLILVGGPAINSLVAELADAGKTLTLDQWRTDYVDKAIVQVVEDAFATGRVALIVAGYEAQNTRDAAAKLLAGEVDDKTAAVISGGQVEDLNM